MCKYNLAVFSIETLRAMAHDAAQPVVVTKFGRTSTIMVATLLYEAIQAELQARLS